MKCVKININISVYINIMERGSRIKSFDALEERYAKEDKKNIQNLLDAFEDFEVTEARARKFIEEKRHKVKRFPKKPTKITDSKEIKEIKQDKIPVKKEIVKKEVVKCEYSDDDNEVNEVINVKKIDVVKPTKKKIIHESYDSSNESDESDKSDKSDDSNDDDHKVIIKNKSDDPNSDEESLSKIQLLNQELFKENSNKSRNDQIKAAWKTLQEYTIPDKDKLTIKKSHPGHFVTMGRGCGSLKNPHWLVEDINGNEYYIMYCEKNGYTKFSVEDYKEVINPSDNFYQTWNYHIATGYITSHVKKDGTRSISYLHQVICKKHNVKKYSTLSVDHINRDKLDNRKENLRFATQSEQNQNTDKRNRKHNAKPLPDGLEQKDMPKYVLYYSEKYGTNKDKFREWLNVEKHPKQNGKKWSTSKSMSITIQDKLKQAKAKLEELNL